MELFWHSFLGGLLMGGVIAVYFCIWDLRRHLRNNDTKWLDYHRNSAGEK